MDTQLILCDHLYSGSLLNLVINFNSVWRWGGSFQHVRYYYLEKRWYFFLQNWIVLYFFVLPYLSIELSILHWIEVTKLGTHIFFLDLGGNLTASHNSAWSIRCDISNIKFPQRKNFAFCSYLYDCGSWSFWCVLKFGLQMYYWEFLHQFSNKRLVCNFLWWIFIWFMYQSNCGLIKELDNVLLSFYFMKYLKSIGVNSSLNVW